MNDIRKTDSNLIFPPKCGWMWHLVPKCRTGCQGFKGPFPSAFLDKWW